MFKLKIQGVKDLLPVGTIIGHTNSKRRYIITSYDFETEGFHKAIVDNSSGYFTVKGLMRGLEDGTISIYDKLEDDV